MRLGPPSIIHMLLVLAPLGVLGSFSGAPGQEVDSAVRDAYLRVVGEHFEVPLQEVVTIGEWELSSDEVPVVLFVAQRAGVSPDALIGVRRGGLAWFEVAGRFGLDARAFHLPLPSETGLGILTRAFEEFNRRPPQEWDQIRLEDGEIVALVNLRVLSEQTGTSPLRILSVREERGSFLASYPYLIRR